MFHLLCHRHRHPRFNGGGMKERERVLVDCACLNAVPPEPIGAVWWRWWWRVRVLQFQLISNVLRLFTGRPVLLLSGMTWQQVRFFLFIAVREFNKWRMVGWWDGDDGGLEERTKHRYRFSFSSNAIFAQRSLPLSVRIC